MYSSFCTSQISFLNKSEIIVKISDLLSLNTLFIAEEKLFNNWGFNSLKNKVRDNYWIKEISPNPNQNDLMKSLKQININKIDLIIAVGGGSSIDLAKAVSALCNPLKNPDFTINDITDFLKKKDFSKSEFVDIIAIPTTSGTGSEVTSWATVWDVSKQTKFSIDHPELKPKIAYICPELTVSLPNNLTLATGLDALSHAIEAYWSKFTNPLVQNIAYRSIELIVKYLRLTINNPTNISYREKMSEASILAGIAFSQTRTTACHSISYPLTMNFNIPHGYATAITLDPVSKINKSHFKNDIDLFDLFKDYGDIKNWIDNVCENIVNLKLSSFNITHNDLNLIVDNAFTGGRMDNNPVDLSKDDVFNILKVIL